MSDRVWIPEISEAKAREINKRIKIVVEFPRMGKYYIRKRGSLHADVFLGEPKFTKPAKELKILRDIRTYHRFGVIGWFNLSFWDVVAQIPKDIVDEVVAFEIVKRPLTLDEMNEEPEALAAGYHAAITRLYTRKGELK